MRTVTKPLVRSLMAVMLSVGIGCATHRIAQNPSTGRVEVQNSGYNAFSPQQEVQLGEQAEAEAMKQLPMLAEDNRVSKYVKKIGSQLAKHAPGGEFKYRFHVVNQKEINAFALPGGPVFVNLGTVQAADDEGQLAGVIAHEISHVALRHATSNASKEQFAQIPLAILGGVLGNGMGGQLARLGISLGANSVFLKYSRDAEKEADELGSQIMYDAGYDPYSMVEFFAKLEKEGGGSGGPQFLSDHPNPGNRQEDVSRIVSKFPKKNFGRADSPEFERVKQEVAGMKPYSAEQVAQMQRKKAAAIQRAAEAEIRPSGSFQQLQAQGFRIAYPSNWQVMNQSNSAVLIAPRAGVSENAIAYGVVISGFRPQPGRDSLDIATRDLASSLAQANPGMQLQGARQIELNGRPAMQVNLVGPSPITDQSGQQIAEQDTLVTVQRDDGTVLFVVFIAPQQDMQALAPTYQQMWESLQMN